MLLASRGTWFQADKGDKDDDAGGGRRDDRDGRDGRDRRDRTSRGDRGFERTQRRWKRPRRRGEGSVAFAGVVPFAVYNGALHFLLAREAFGPHRGQWSGFAGGPEPTDGADVLDTAAREASEESGGLLGTAEDLAGFLRRRGHRVDVAGGTHFLLPFPYSAFFPVQFRGVRAQMTAIVSSRDGYHPCVEKDAVRWMSDAELRGVHTATDVRFRAGFAADLPALLAAASVAVAVPAPVALTVPAVTGTEPAHPPAAANDARPGSPGPTTTM